MDNHTPEQRRKNMQAVKNKDSQIELLLRKELWSRGLRYNWEERKRDFKSHQEFWIPKIECNMGRDREVTAKLEAEGWTVIRFWGNDIKKETARCADIIEIAYKEKD